MSALIIIEPQRGPVRAVRSLTVYEFSMTTGASVRVHARNMVEAFRAWRKFGYHPSHLKEVTIP